MIDDLNLKGIVEPLNLDGLVEPSPSSYLKAAGYPKGKAALDLIAKYESGNRNVPNYNFGKLTSDGKQQTAQGYFQITNTNWKSYGPRAGVNLGQYPSAMAAPREVQERVAGLMHRERGFQDWAPFNPKLRQAIQRGETVQSSQPQLDDGLNLDGIVEPLNLDGLTESVIPPVPMQLSTDDTEWHFGESIPNPSPRAMRVLEEAVAEDERKKKLYGHIDPPDIVYQNKMRAKAGLKPLTVNPALMVPGMGSLAQVRAQQQAQAVSMAPGIGSLRQVAQQQLDRKAIRQQVLSEESALQRQIASDPLHGQNIALKPRTPQEIDAEVERRLAEEPTDAERTQAAPQIAAMESQNYFQRQWERGTPEIASFIHKAQATLGRDLSRILPGGVGARLNTAADMAQSQARVDDLVAQHEYTGDQTVLRGIGKTVVEQAFSLTPLIASEAATGIPFPVLMAGQSYLENGNKPASQRLTAAGTAYLLGKAYQTLPGMSVRTLQSVPGRVGELALAHPEIAARVVGAGGFGAVGAGETLARGGTAKQALIAGVAQAIPGAALAGAPEEAPTARIDTMPNIPDVPVGTISEPRVIKKGEQANATQKGIVTGNGQFQYQGTEGVGQTAEAGSRDSVVKSGQVQQEGQVRKVPEPLASVLSAPPVEGEAAKETRQLEALENAAWAKLKAAKGTEGEDRLRLEWADARKAAEISATKDYFAAGGKYIDLAERVRLTNKSTPLDEYIPNKDAIRFSELKDRYGIQAETVQAAGFFQRASPSLEPTAKPEALNLKGLVEPQKPATQPAENLQTDAAPPERVAASTPSEGEVSTPKAAAPELQKYADQAAEVRQKSVNADLTSFERAAIERKAARLEAKARGEELRHAGVDPTELLDDIIIRGGELLRTGKASFDEWSRKLREEFGPQANEHLKNVWAQLTSPIPDVPRMEDTGIKHAIVEAERELQGLPQFAKARRAHGQSFDEGVYDVQSGRIKPRELASDIVRAFYDPKFSMERFQSRRPRPLSTEESMALLYDRMRISNERKAAEAELEAANQSSDAGRTEKAMDEISRLQQASNANDEADYVAGGEQGRGLAIRREMIKDDFSRARVLSQALALNKGKPLPAHITAALEEKVAELARANERIAELESKQQAASAHSEIEKVIEKTQREVRTQKRQRDRQVLDVEAASIKDQIAAAWKRRSGVQPSGLAGLDPEGELTKLLGMLARNRVEAGISKAADLVDAVHEMVKDVADLTKRDVQDLISGYGKTSKPQQDEIGAKLSELKGIMRVMSGKADVVEKGIRPLRSGFQRPKPTQALREALRDLRDTLRMHGIEIEKSARSPEDQQKSILDAAKTTARNRIEDLTKWIADGKRTVADKTVLIPDAELKTLRAERDRLNDVFKALDDPDADQRSITAALGAANKSILEMEAKVRSGESAPSPRQSVSPWSEELGKAKQRQTELRQQLADMRKAAKPKADPEVVRIQSALKTTSRSIVDMQERLRTGQIENTGTKSAPWSPELGKLKQQQASLAKQLSEARKAARPVVDKDARELEQRLKAADKSISSLEVKIKSGQIAPKVATAKPTSLELEAARATQKTLQGILRDMRTAERRANKPAEDPFVTEARKVLNAQKAFMERNQKSMDAMQKELTEAQRIAKEGGQRPEKTRRTPTPLTDEMRVAKRNANQLRRDIDNVYSVIDWANKTKTQKGFAYAAAGVRAGVLSGVKVLAKIGGALGQRIPQQYIEEGYGALFSKVVSGAEKAPRHGGGVSPAAEAAYLRGLASGAMEAPRIILTGESELSLEHGRRYPNIPTKLGTALAIPGRVHAAEKNPLKVAEYNRSFERNLQWAERQGMDRANPDVIEQAKDRAYKDANEIVLLGDNPITRSLTNMQRGWSDVGRSLFKIGVPVAKVPSNYLSQMIGDYGLGLVRGGLRALKQRNPEILERLTPEEADKTMRLLKRGSLGLVYMALAASGGGGAITLGGFWSKKRKGERREVEPGDVKIGPATISHLWLHSPPDELAQLAGTMRREIDNRAARKESMVRRVATGTAHGAKGVLDQVPFLSRYTRTYDSFRNGDALLKMLGDTVADWVEPQIVQELAKATDREEKGQHTTIPWKGEAVQRKAKGFGDALLVGLPVGREYVKKDRKKMLEMRRQERPGSVIPPVPGTLNLSGLVAPSPTP